MPSLVRLSAIPASLILALGTGCVAPTEPLLPEGTFALQAFASHPLPAVTFESVVVRQSIVADTLFIAADGGGIRRLTRRSEFLDGSRSPQELRQDIEFTITRDGQRVVVAEQVGCLASHEAEGCGPHPAALSGSILDIGLRRYTRVIAAP